MFFNHRSRLLPWMLQRSKIILVTFRCTLLLFCVTVIEPVVGDCRNKCCCGKERTQQDLSVGCELLCLPAESPVWAQQKSRGLQPSSEKFSSFESGKCTIVKGWENTQYLKWNCTGCVGCTGLWGYQGMHVPTVGCLCSKGSCLHTKGDWARWAEFNRALPLRLLKYPNVQLPCSRKAVKEHQEQLLSSVKPQICCPRLCVCLLLLCFSALPVTIPVVHVRGQTVHKVVSGSARSSVFHWPEQQGVICCWFVHGVFWRPGCHICQAVCVYCSPRAVQARGLGFKSAKHLMLSGCIVFGNTE